MIVIAIPGANNLEVLRNVGHCPLIEAPMALAERLLSLLPKIMLIEFGEVAIWP